MIQAKFLRHGVCSWGISLGEPWGTGFFHSSPLSPYPRLIVIPLGRRISHFGYIIYGRARSLDIFYRLHIIKSGLNHKDQIVTKVTCEKQMDQLLARQVCFKYYEKDMTQREIADRFNLSKMRVSRMLQKAKELIGLHKNKNVLNPQKWGVKNHPF